ncbi:MAG: glycosyl hydrolase family 30, partial [Dysgonamonadaceae bacterium]|nr:glycosyl hydrolase family 30 [Dysgonamonadaceae bacterium]
TLPEETRTDVLNKLFSPSEANFTLNRMPMGASDYALSFYSFNEVADDWTMANFNIDRDRYILLPYIKAAKKINPRLKIWASPWSPPAWMKTNGHYAGSSAGSSNGLAPGQANAPDATGFKMLAGYLEAYALYFSKFIKAYEREGVPVEAVHVQNEPCSNQKFPSCKWRAEDLAYFIGEYLGPQFEKDSIATEIFFGTINTRHAGYFHTALKDEKAMKYIRGLGFQWSGKDAIPVIHRENPQLRLWQTESECGNGKNEWQYAEYTWSLMNRYLSNGANVYTYWNMVLDHTGVSTWGWRQNSLVSINRQTGEVQFNYEYYLMKHLSGWVEPGAYRLKTNESADHLAFVNPGGKIVVVIANPEKREKNIRIAYRNQWINIPVKAKSFNTVRF